MLVVSPHGALDGSRGPPLELCARAIITQTQASLGPLCRLSTNSRDTSCRASPLPPAEHPAEACAYLMSAPAAHRPAWRRSRRSCHSETTR